MLPLYLLYRHVKRFSLAIYKKNLLTITMPTFGVALAATPIRTQRPPPFIIPYEGDLSSEISNCRKSLPHKELGFARRPRHPKCLRTKGLGQQTTTTRRILLNRPSGTGHNVNLFEFITCLNQQFMKRDCMIRIVEI
jgi:hypothetical protein